MPTFSGGFALPTATAADAAERLLGVVLPRDYKQFLLTVNGGTPDPNCFVVPDRGDALVDLLYGIAPQPAPGNLAYEQAAAAERDPLPAGFVAIGHDPGGASLLLGTAGNDAGRVLFWDRAGLWVRSDGYNTFPVSATFTEFLASLRPLRDQA